MLEDTPGPKGGEEAGKNKFKTGTAGGSSGSYGANQVYMGLVPAPAPGVGRDSVLTGSYGQNLMPKQPLLVSKSDAYNFINTLNGKALSGMQAKMRLAGLIGDNDGFLEMNTKWKKLVDASLGLTKAGRKVSPMDILDSYLGKGPLGGKGGLAGIAGGSLWQVEYRGGRKFLVNQETGQVKYQGPRFETTYDKTIDLTDPTTAKAIATTVFQQLMHRDPGAGELSGWSDALRTAEQNSPVVTHQTTEYDMDTGEPIGTTEKREGGLSSDAKQYMAEQRVKKTKEYASTQAATTYMNALEEAIFNNPFGSV